MGVVDKTVDGEKFDRGDTEILYVPDNLLLAETGIGAAQRFRNARMQLGKPFNMGFIKDCPVPRAPDYGSARPPSRNSDRPLRTLA